MKCAFTSSLARELWLCLCQPYSDWPFRRSCRTPLIWPAAYKYYFPGHGSLQYVSFPRHGLVDHYSASTCTCTCPFTSILKSVWSLGPWSSSSLIISRLSQYIHENTLFPDMDQCNMFLFPDMDQCNRFLFPDMDQCNRFLFPDMDQRRVF